MLLAHIIWGGGGNHSVRDIQFFLHASWELWKWKKCRQIPSSHWKEINYSHLVLTICVRVTKATDVGRENYVTFQETARANPYIKVACYFSRGLCVFKDYRWVLYVAQVIEDLESQCRKEINQK